MSTPTTREWPSRFPDDNDSGDTIMYELENNQTSPQTKTDFEALVTEAGIPAEVFRNPSRIHSRTHRTIPAWLVESDEEEEGEPPD